MLSVEVYTAQQQFAINTCSSKLTVSVQSKFNLSDSKIKSNQSSGDEASIKITIEDDYWGDSLDDQVSLHSPTQCCSQNVEGELVITTNQPFNWSSHTTACGEWKVSNQHYQLTKQNNLAAIQDNCTFNVNCVAVLENLSA